MQRFFLALVCAAMCFLGSVNAFADATCARAIAFYPADGKGNADKSSPPVVIRVESNSATVAESKRDVIMRGDNQVAAWSAKMKRSISPTLIIKQVRAKPQMGKEEIG